MALILPFSLPSANIGGASQKCARAASWQSSIHGRRHLAKIRPELVIEYKSGAFQRRKPFAQAGTLLHRRHAVRSAAWLLTGRCCDICTDKTDRTKFAPGPRVVIFAPTHLPLTIGSHISRMFGPRITTVFASRWRALWFAASICLLAYCSVPQQSATPPANNDEAIAQAAIGDDPFAQAAHPTAENAPDLTAAANNDDVKRVQALLNQLPTTQ